MCCTAVSVNSENLLMLYSIQIYMNRSKINIHPCTSYIEYKYINIQECINSLTVSHMHPDTHTHTHRSAACGRYPRRYKTSCIPHAYITPSPPPPADHSSLYPPQGRKNTPSHSLSLKSARQAPPAIEHDFVTLPASKKHITPKRSACIKLHLRVKILCW